MNTVPTWAQRRALRLLTGMPVTAAGFAARMWDEPMSDAEAVTYLERLFHQGWVDVVTVDGVETWRVSAAGLAALEAGGDGAAGAGVA